MHVLDVVAFKPFSGELKLYVGVYIHTHTYARVFKCTRTHVCFLVAQLRGPRHSWYSSSRNITGIKIDHTVSI